MDITDEDDAFTVYGPVNAIDRLAYLNVSPVENAPNVVFHVRGFAAFGSATIQADETDAFRISVRQAILQVLQENCQLDAASVREEILQDGNFADETAEVRDTKTETAVGAGLKTTLSALKQEGAFSLQGGINRAASGTKSYKAEIQEKISRVEFVAGGWRFGARTGGDPIKNFGPLDGKYLDGIMPWAAFRLLPRKVSCRVHFDLWLPHGMLIERVTARPSRWFPESKKQTTDRQSAFQVLKIDCSRDGSNFLLNAPGR